MSRLSTAPDPSSTAQATEPQKLQALDTLATGLAGLLTDSSIASTQTNDLHSANFESRDERPIRIEESQLPGFDLSEILASSQPSELLEGPTLFRNEPTRMPEGILYGLNIPGLPLGTSEEVIKRDLPEPPRSKDPFPETYLTKTSSWPSNSEPAAIKALQTAPSTKKEVKTGKSNHLSQMNVYEEILRYGHDEDYEPHDDPDFLPTDAPAGSEEKIAVLRYRVEQGFPLWHEDDRVDYSGLTGAIRPRD